MNRLFQYFSRQGITRRFLVFFMLSCILPMLILSVLFLEKTHDILEKRNTELLQAGLLFSQETLRDELDKLGILTTQLASLSLEEQYNTYLKSRQPAVLEAILNQYVASKSLDYLLLVNRQGQLVAFASPTSSPGLPGISNSMRQVIQSTLNENIVTSIESVGNRMAYKNSPGNAMMMIAAAPVVSTHQRHQVLGALIVGRHLSKGFSKSEFASLHVQNLKLRIYLNEHQALNLISSSFEKNNSQLPENAKAHSNRPNMLRTFTHYATTGLPFRETLQTIPPEGQMGQELYKSMARDIKNYAREPIGFLVVSVSRQGLDELQRQNILYITIYFVSGLILVTLLGSWFQRSFVTPMSDLAKVTEQVASGDLAARVKNGAGYTDVDYTLRSFNMMLDELQEKDGLRKSFVSTLTHDLRTPLIAQERVIGFLRLHLKNTIDQQSDKLLEGLLSSNTHLLQMVNSLLEIYQYESGKTMLYPTPVNLGVLVDECVSDVQALAGAKSIMLNTRVPDTFPPLVADRTQLKRVVINMLGNAIENIQEQGTVWVEAGMFPDSADAVELVEIQVRDNGPGIEPERIPHLFERYSADPGRRQKIGAGLGLYICRMIVERHGGRIGVESSPETGTTFTVTLPLSPAVSTAVF